MNCKLPIAVVSTAWLVLATAGAGQAETLTFDELVPPTPVDGLSIKGVTFDFKLDNVDSTDAVYNLSLPPEFPGNLFVNLQAPSLQGNAKGILTLDFAEPISALEFAAGVEAFGPITPALIVELFDPKLNTLGRTPVNTTSIAVLSEGLFTYSGVPVQRVILDFDETMLGLNETSDPRFSLDNLTYTAVPEPSSFVGLLAMCVSGGALRWLRKKQHKA